MKKLVLGLALVAGTFAMAQQKQRPLKMDPAQRQAMMEKKRAAKLDNMQKELNLSTEQMSKIRAIQNQRQQERQLARAETMKMQNKRLEAAKKERQQMDDDMRAILTPDQYQKWQANKQSKMPHKRHKEMQQPKR